MDLGGGYIEDPVLNLHADQDLLDDFNEDTKNSISTGN
tara:strand:+ start:18639 stop:18752 length:114 start_codon:yes stop_codon:yes gene_type:complete